MVKLTPSNHILLLEEKKEGKFLREKTKDIPPELMKDKEFVRDLRKIFTEMRRLMVAVDGVGLSANQAGMPYRFFIARVPDGNGRWKFHSVVNPKILKHSKEKESTEEGCLSVPGKFGPVERHFGFEIEFLNLLGKKQRIAAKGLLARIFQHEIDHLDGKLFIDRAKYVEDVRLSEETHSI